MQRTGRGIDLAKNVFPFPGVDNQRRLGHDVRPLAGF
jgi:hypothetical protein